MQAYRFRGQIGLINIARTLLGESVTVALDLLARNAFIRDSVRNHVIAGGATTTTSGKPDFSGILETDVFDKDVGREVWRAMAYADIPMAANPNGVSGSLFVTSTPDLVNTIKSETTSNSQWREAHLYADPSVLLRYEVGMWENQRFIQSRRNVLWNCGVITLQAVTQADAFPGDGASDEKVDGVYNVGLNTGVTAGIALDSVVGLAVNDIVTVHQSRTSDYGITNGVDPLDPWAFTRRIVKISGNTVYFDKPVFKEVPAGSFVTKGRHIHVAVFIGGPGVANGVGEPIMMYPMEPIDDARAIYRFIWQGRFRYQGVNPEYWHVVFHGGTDPAFGIGTAP